MLNIIIFGGEGGVRTYVRTIFVSKEYSLMSPKADKKYVALMWNA